MVGNAHSDGEVLAAKEQLARAVEAARGLGMSWQTIGDALGMRRGAAYQRFRRPPPPRSFGLHESPIDGVTVLAVRGDLDAVTVPQLADAINRCLADVPMGLIVDLEGLTFLSSAGAGILVAGDESARSFGKRFAVAAPSPIADRTLKMLGVDQALHSYPTVHAAMVGLHRADDARPDAPMGDDGQA